jgi:uncharacterized protein YecE (DUF72 family)
MAATALVGCSGWMYDSWRGGFYPEGLPKRRWLEHYASRFDTVEVNNTFYRLPSREAVAGWAEQTPAGFEFAVKASRYLTHVKRLRELEAGYARFSERIAPLREAGKLGPILWQLPANFQRDDERLAAALEALGEGRHCFEFRHPSWFTNEVYALLGEAGAALVVGDHPKWPFQARVLTTDWTLVRLHWGRRGRRGNYSDREISTWARRLAQWRRRAAVFAYFNNDWEAFAVDNAMKLDRSLG